MRIGLEMFGTQTAGRHRGVGRYCRNLAAALARRPGHELILYADATLPLDTVPTLPDALLRLIRPEPTMRDALDRLARGSEDGLDALILANPLEMVPGHDPPGRPIGSPRPLIAAVVYDLIPLIFPDDYLRRWTGLAQSRRYFWTLERLRQYDGLLAISEATRDDVVRLMDMPGEKVANIGTGGDGLGNAFSPTNPSDDASDLAAVKRLGLDGPFVFAVAATDPRKNLDGLLNAFSRLPKATLASHKLAVAAGITSTDPNAAPFLSRAEALGIRDRLVLTGAVDDTTLRALYRRAEVFVFPSRYEGFGLPILEALRCGAAVVAGDNSSQPEAAGNAAVLVNTDNSEALSAAIQRLLTDPEHSRILRSRGPAHAATFTWDAVADRTLSALEGLAQRPETAIPTPRRLALFASTTKAQPLLSDLCERYTVDVFHHETEAPIMRSRRDSNRYDHRLFPRLDRVRPYDKIMASEGGPTPPNSLERGRLLR